MGWAKRYIVTCDQHGCQSCTQPWRTRQGARQEAKTYGWKLFTDERKARRALCPTHHH